MKSDYSLNPLDCIVLVYSDDANKLINSSMLEMSSFVFLLKEPANSIIQYGKFLFLIWQNVEL